MDVGWRRTAVRELRLAPGAVVLDLACGTGDLCRELDEAGSAARSASTSRPGCSRNARVAAPLVRGDALRLPFPTASVDGVVSGLRAAQLRRRSTRSSPSARACCGPAGASRCSTSPSRARRRCAPLHGVWFRRGRAVRRRARLRPAARTRTCPRPPRTCRRRPSSRWPSPRPASTRSSAARSASAPRSCSPGRARDHRLARPRAPRSSRTPRPIADPGDLLDHLGAGGFAWLDGDAGFVTAGVVDRFPMHRAAAALAALAHVRDHDAPPSAGPRASARCRSKAAAISSSRRASSPATPTAARGAPRSTGADVPTALHVPHAPPDPVRGATRASRPTSGAPRLEHSARRDRRRRDREGRARPRGRRRRRRAVRRRRRARHPARRRNPAAPSTRPTASSAPAPSCSCAATAATVVSRPMAGTGDDPSALLASAKDAHEHRIVVDAIAAALRDRCESRRAATGPPRCASRPSPTSRRRSAAGSSTRRSSPSTDLVELLHPTPAVGGWPAAPARTHDPHARRPRPRPVRGRVRLGRRRTATASSSSRCAARRSTDRTRGSTPARASSRARSPARSGPRPRPSSSRCSARSSAPSYSAARATAAATADHSSRWRSTLFAAVDGNDEHARVAGGQRGRQLAEIVDARRRSTPCARATATRSRPCGRPEERSNSGRSSWGRNEKMPPPSLSMTTNVGARSGAEQAVGVVQEAQVAAQRRRSASSHGRDARRPSTRSRRCRWRRGSRARGGPSRGAMHHSSARTGRLDATDERRPFGKGGREVARDHTFESARRTRRARGRSPRARSCSACSQPSSHVATRSRRGSPARARAHPPRRASSASAGDAHPLARACVGSSHASVGIDDDLRTGSVEPRVRDLARERRADAQHEVGPVRAGERRRAEQRLVGRDRVRPGPHLRDRVGEQRPTRGGGEPRHASRASRPHPSPRRRRRSGARAPSPRAARRGAASGRDRRAACLRPRCDRRAARARRPAARRWARAVRGTEG